MTTFMIISGYVVLGVAFVMSPSPIIGWMAGVYGIVTTMIGISLFLK